MDPKLVAKAGRPAPEDMTPLQRRGFSIVDEYLRQGIPAELLFRWIAPAKLPANVSSADELVNYQLVIKTGQGYIEIFDWEDPSKTPRKKLLPRGQRGDDLVHELLRQELVFLDNIESEGDDLPLTEVDMAAIGIGTVTNAVDEPAELEPEVSDDDGGSTRSNRSRFR